MSPPWWAAVPAAETRIRCGPGEHVLRWQDGRLVPADHPDAEGELVLAALGGDRAECVSMTEAWGRHSDDLEVLVLGPRSPADELAVTPEFLERLRSGPGARAGLARAGYTGLAGRGGMGGGPPVPHSMPMRRAAGPDSPGRARREELLTLLALGPAFQLRLSATVAAAWSAGGSRWDGRGPARPALIAALTGRLAPAAGPWLGIDPANVRAAVHEGLGWGSMTLDGRTLRAALPLGWLASVWAPGFPVIGGHLVVGVLDVTWPQAQVLGLRQPGAEPAVLSIRHDGEHWTVARAES
jgi:hypothetical protein